MNLSNSNYAWVTSLRTLSVLCAIAIAMVVSPGGVGAQAIDPGTAVPNMQLHVRQIDSLHWRVTVNLENTNALAALTLPFRWGTGESAYLIDSATYWDTRIDYFALKTYLVDTTDQTVLIGLISDLGMDYPPLEPGDGPIAYLYFTAQRPTEKRLALDTTLITPHNTLQVVTPDIRALTPRFGVRYVPPER